MAKSENNWNNVDLMLAIFAEMAKIDKGFR